MTEAMPFLQKYDITFLRPPTIRPVPFCTPCGINYTGCVEPSSTVESMPFCFA